VQTLASLGLGLNWQPFSGLVLRADYGVPLMGTSDRVALIFHSAISRFDIK